MFYIHVKNFPLLTLDEIKEQINMRINGLKNQRGTGIPRKDVLISEITTLKKLWRKKK